VGQTPDLIVFDLGGVMVRVTYEWRLAIDTAGVRAERPENLDRKLGECPLFDTFQAGKIELQPYLDALAEFHGLSSQSDALRVHQSILVHPFPGTLELVSDLHAAGVRTAILSNTNAPHWDEMKGSGRFPAIAALQLPVLSHEVREEKPDAAIYRSLERLSGCQPGQILFFDDLPANVEAARACGWDAERIDPNTDPAQQTRSYLNTYGVL
jgi:HAD superfamily hydrolase (TIGR01509 family)